MKPIVFLIIFYSFICMSQTNNSDVTPFLEHIVSQFPNVRDVAISGNEVVFSAQNITGDVSVLIYLNNKNDLRSNPKVISFSGKYFDIEPFFSQDGMTLFFVSNRPLENTSHEAKDFDIWFVTRPSIEVEWSVPKNIGTPINSNMDEFYPVITQSGNLYFTLNNPELEHKDDIYVSEYINGNYSKPKRLEDNINSDGYEYNAFVSPDESFMIYTCYNREDGYGSGDLYLSFNNSDGWSKAKNMGAVINSNKMDYCPYVDIKTNSLYFTSKRFISSNSENQLNIEDLKAIFNRYENGASRLYKTNIAVDLNKQ